MYKMLSWNGKTMPFNYNRGCAYAHGFVVLAEGLDMIRLRAVATGRMSSHQAIYPF
jgi:hypothetical protein